MQTILIDWGRRHRIRLADLATRRQAPATTSLRLDNLVHLQRCLDRLGALDPRAREVVELRFFVGLSIEETAEFLSVCPRTVRQDWTFARCWLAQNWGASH
jgi:RNA polymerase sigma factor (sigma-70 family)